MDEMTKLLTRIAKLEGAVTAQDALLGVLIEEVLRDFPQHERDAMALALRANAEIIDRAIDHDDATQNTRSLETGRRVTLYRQMLTRPDPRERE